ncbi:ATP-binding protein [candidate division KSB1 bacterium]|nr:ATP-binding protein [candidate division KSB1 bacterium]
MAKTKTQRHRLVIKSDLNEVPVVEEFTEKLSTTAQFSEADRDSIAISVTELVSNAISHGNKCSPDKKVTIEFEVNKEVFIVSVQDEGDGFKPEEVADPLAPENLLKDSGRGVYIVRTLMDETEITVNETGTLVRITKRSQTNPKI